MANDAATDVAVETEEVNKQSNPEVKAEPAPTIVPRSLSHALILARKACRSTVYKAAENKAQSYRYVGHEQVLTSGAREALLSHGLTLEQRSVKYAGELIYSNRSGQALVWRWVGTFVLAWEGQERSYEFEATTVPNDKAAFVASTALDRVAHLRILQLAGSSDEDPEHDRNDERENREGRAAPPAGAGRPERTADPPSNVRRLEQPSRGPESSARETAVQLFRAKLQQKRKPSELVDWGIEVSRSKYPVPIKRALIDMLAQHCKSLRLDYEAIADAINNAGGA